MTGLDYFGNDCILSLACFVSDANMNLLDEHGYIIDVKHDLETLQSMGEWCKWCASSGQEVRSDGKCLHHLTRLKPR